MKYSSVITPKVAEGFVSRQTNLGIDSYDLDELYSPDTAMWKSRVLDLGSPKYPPQVATAPQRYWFDRSRYNNHGTIVGATWKQLPSGVWVLSFDGNDDWINFGNKQFVTRPFTMEAWVDRNVAGVNHPILARDYAAADPTTWSGFWWMISDTNHIYWMFSDGNTLTARDVGTMTNTTGLMHLALVANLANNVWCYQDGAQTYTEASTQAIAYGATNQANRTLGAGRRPGEAVWFNGKISLLRYYNRALSALEIANHFNQ